jgi:hypothetical protein
MHLLLSSLPSFMEVISHHTSTTGTPATFDTDSCTDPSSKEKYMAFAVGSGTPLRIAFRVDYAKAMEYV